MSNPKSDPLSLNSPTLWIDFRRGSVEMRHGNDVWLGELPMSSADRSQCNTSSGSCQLQKLNSAQLQEREAS